MLSTTICALYRLQEKKKTRKEKEIDGPLYLFYVCFVLNMYTGYFALPYETECNGEGYETLRKKKISKTIVKKNRK